MSRECFSYYDFFATTPNENQRDPLCDLSTCSPEIRILLHTQAWLSFEESDFSSLISVTKKQGEYTRDSF